MSWMYDEYLKEHIQNVNKGFQWMLDNLELTTEERIAVWNCLNDGDHDRSKFEKFEYEAYDAYFYGGNRSYKVVQTFNYAWLQHIHKNPHHWQYWILINDDPTEFMNVALEMPLNYIFEMIADWWTFSWKSGNLTEIFEWYKDHEGRIIFHKNTLKTVESILKRMKEKLEYDDSYKVVRTDESPTYVGFTVKNDASPNYIHDVTEVVEHSDTKDEDSDEDNPKKFGVPEIKKFPMPDADHVRSAIRFFNYIDPKYEKELAEAILERAEEYGVDISEMDIGDVNRFKKYLPEEKEKEKSDAES